jgi:hypothetical protein
MTSTDNRQQSRYLQPADQLGGTFPRGLPNFETRPSMPGGGTDWALPG